MYHVDYVSLGKRIRARRRQKGLTQEMLAELCELSGGYIGDIERADRTPSVQCIITLSLVLEISLDAMFVDTLPESLFSDVDVPDTPLPIRQPDRTLRNTLTNWYFADLPDESLIGEPPVTNEQIARLQFSFLSDPMPFSDATL